MKTAAIDNPGFEPHPRSMGSFLPSVASPAPSPFNTPRCLFGFVQAALLILSAAVAHTAPDGRAALWREASLKSAILHKMAGLPLSDKDQTLLASLPDGGADYSLSADGQAALRARLEMNGWGDIAKDASAAASQAGGVDAWLRDMVARFDGVIGEFQKQYPAGPAAPKGEDAPVTPSPGRQGSPPGTPGPGQMAVGPAGSRGTSTGGRVNDGGFGAADDGGGGDGSGGEAPAPHEPADLSAAARGLSSLRRSAGSVFGPEKRDDASLTPGGSGRWGAWRAVRSAPAGAPTSHAPSAATPAASAPPTFSVRDRAATTASGQGPEVASAGPRRAGLTMGERSSPLGSLPASDGMLAAAPGFGVAGSFGGSPPFTGGSAPGGRSAAGAPGVSSRASKRPAAADDSELTDADRRELEEVQSLLTEAEDDTPLDKDAVSDAAGRLAQADGPLRERLAALAQGLDGMLSLSGRDLTPSEHDLVVAVASAAGLTPAEAEKLVRRLRHTPPPRPGGRAALSWWQRLLLWAQARWAGWHGSVARFMSGLTR